MASTMSAPLAISSTWERIALGLSRVTTTGGFGLFLEPGGLPSAGGPPTRSRATAGRRRRLLLLVAPSRAAAVGVPLMLLQRVAVDAPHPLGRIAGRPPVCQPYYFRGRKVAPTI